MSQPKYKIGDRVVIRDHGFFGDSSTYHVMLIEEVSENHAGPGWHRYYGKVEGQGPRGVYEDDVTGIYEP